MSSDFHVATPALRALLAASALVSVPLISDPVHAQRWAVIAVAETDAEIAAVVPVADHVRAALHAQGEIVADPESTGATVETEVSSSITDPPASLIGDLEGARRPVLSAIAQGRTDAALELGERVLREASAHTETIARTDDGARALGDLCLFLARAELEAHRREAARSRLEVCASLVYDFEPAYETHPPEIRDMFLSVRADLAGTSGADLLVSTAPGDPAGCDVRLNGRIIGRTPRASRRLPPGTYALDVGCDGAAPARMRSVVLAPGSHVEIQVHPRLMAAVRSTPVTALAYGRLPDAAELAMDLASLARVLRVDRILAVVVSDAGTSVRAYGIESADVAARALGSAPLPVPIDFDGSRRAVEEVAGIGRAAERGESAGAQPSTGEPGVAILGGSLVAVGLAGLGVAWYFWGELEARGRDVAGWTAAESYQSAQRAFDDARYPVLIAGSAGGVLATIGLPMLLPREDGIPWWSWIIGAAGAGVAAVGVYELTVDGACFANETFTDPCPRRSQTWALGTLILEHAAPLLAVPITHLIRAALGETIRPRVSARVEPDHIELRFSGSF